MRLTEAQLPLLCCPVCYGNLRFAPVPDAIDCTACHRRYPIVDDLPVLIPERASLPSERHTSTADQNG